MKNLKYFIFVLIILLPSYSFAENKIVFIDIDFLMKNSNIGKLSLKKLENLNTKNVKILKDNEQILKDKENILLQKKNIISKEEFEKEINNLRIQINDFKVKKDNMVKDFNNLKVEELNKVLAKFNIKIQDYMSQNSIDIVLNKNNIFIGKVTSDITKSVLVEINNEFKE
ncbi:OmpH family outer membrane protein [Candidatus Pelagibacter sp.]|mgnify:FL=1|jgi:outer membrane protein|nr:OmpH family outer membrane protein [Candidatus Pelagibacter sp.]|tara:strand:+ start:3883 stop:4392 length:510 start_codon:yes stop_codon:yes gene_type:complete